MYMVKKDFDYFKERLDKIYDISYQNNGELIGIKEHLKTLNGKVATHQEKLAESEKRFAQVYDDFRSREDLQKSSFEVYKEKMQCEIDKIKKEMTDDSRTQEREIFGVKLKLIGLVTVLTTIVAGVVNFLLK